MKRECVVVDGVECVVQVGFLPTVSLFDLVIEAEGRLFLDCCVHPLNGLAVLIKVERDDPVLTDAAVLAHVEADLAFDFGVDQPVAALDAETASVQMRE